MEYGEKLKQIRDERESLTEQIKIFSDEIVGADDSIRWSNQIILNEEKKRAKFLAEKSLLEMRLGKLEVILEQAHKLAEKEAEKKPLLKQLEKIRECINETKKVIAS